MPTWMGASPKTYWAQRLVDEMGGAGVGAGVSASSGGGTSLADLLAMLKRRRDARALADALAKLRPVTGDFPSGFSSGFGGYA